MQIENSMDTVGKLETLWIEKYNYMKYTITRRQILKARLQHNRSFFK